MRRTPRPGTRLRGQGVSDLLVAAFYDESRSQVRCWKPNDARTNCNRLLEIGVVGVDGLKVSRPRARLNVGASFEERLDFGSRLAELRFELAKLEGFVFAMHDPAELFL